MIIESIIRRPLGTLVTLDDKDYDFQPTESGGEHVCKVSDAEHIEKFLAVEEAFREYGNQSSKSAPTQTPTIDDTGMSSGTPYDSMTKAELGTLIIERELSVDKLAKLKRKSLPTLVGILMEADAIEADAIEADSSDTAE